MIRFAILVVVAMGIIMVANGQSYTISGYVQEKKSREPLSGVNILREKGNRGAVTNNAGFFSLKLPTGINALTFTFIGYQPTVVRMEHHADTTLTIYMEEESTIIDEVVVTAPDKSVSVSERGIVGVNIKQVRTAPTFLGEPDIIKYMQILPGVSPGREGSSQLVVRGGSGDQSLIMLDDMPVYNQNHSFGLISIFNSDALSGAELYKGYIPEKYGGRISAVASMRMRDGNRYEHHQSLSLGTLTMGGMAEGPIKRGKGSYILSARRFTPDILLRGTYLIMKNIPLQLLYSFYDLNGKVNYDVGDRSKLSFSIYNGRDAFSSSNFDFDENKTIAKSGSGFKWGNLSAALKMESRLGGSYFLSNSVYYSALSNNTSMEYNDIIGSIRRTGTSRSDLSELGYRGELQFSAGKHHALNAGINLSLFSFSPFVTTSNSNGYQQKRSIPIREVYTASIYAGDNLSFGNLNIGLGIRASVYDNSATRKIAIEPRIAADYRVNSSNNTYISYTSTTQPLNSYSRNFLAYPLDFWVPYEGKRIATANQLAAGWKSSSIKWLTLSMEVYYKKMENLLYVVTPEDYLTGESEVFSSSGRAYGVELLGAYSRKRLSVTMSYTYSRSLLKANGVTFPFAYDTPHNFNTLVSYTTRSNAIRTQKLSVNVAWRSGLPFRLSEGSYIVNGTKVDDIPKYPNTRITPYFRSDISYSFEKKLKRGRRVWQLSILNVTGYTNPYLIYNENNKYKFSTLIPILPSFSYIRYW